MPEKAVLTTTVSNIYIGDWGVSLFFIISGAALMYVYEKKCELKTFYKKRFFSIYPMFWMAYIAAFIYSFYADKMMPGTCLLYTSDLQDPPSLLTQMYETIKEGTYDCVGTKRVDRKEMCIRDRLI